MFTDRVRSLVVALQLLGCCANASPATTPGPAPGDTLAVYILAGQSNALNWHCDAALLPPDPADTSILFFFHTGAPPDRSYPVPFNATSGGAWTTLQSQHQDPFIAHRENFFGPEMGLGRTLTGRGERVAILKCAYFGTDLIHDWRKGDTSGAGLYGVMLNQVSAATGKLDSAGVPFSYRGFFWMQGETDAASAGASAAYGTNLTRFIQDLRDDLGTGRLPFILGRIGNASSYPYKDVVRSAQVAVAASIENVGWVDTDDLPLDTDNIHLVAPGALALGTRMAAEYLSTTTGVASPPLLSVELEGIFPNPFNASAMIRLRFSRGGDVSLRVYDLIGREVAVIMGGWLPAGSHTFRFDATHLAGGIYVFLAQAGGGVRTGKMVLLR